MNSLRSRITWLWIVLVAVCMAMLFVLLSADQVGPSALVAQAQSRAAGACGSIRNSVDRLVPPSEDGRSALMDVVVDLSLREADGIEGGVWDAGHGFSAYAYPTYEKGMRKTDIPVAEEPSIERLARQVLADRAPHTVVRQGSREAVVIAACALPRDQVAWTLTRVASAQAVLMQRVTVAAALALGVAALSGAWLLVGLRRWSHNLAGLESELAQRQGDTARIGTRGERDLDRLVLAFNTSAARIEALDADSERLNRELAQADRLAALGRIAAGLAHEIRNPLGSMRLRAENALAVSGETALERRSVALTAVLATVDRIDGLVGSLLALTSPARPLREETDLAPWLREAVEFRREQAERQSTRLESSCPADMKARIDPVALARALDNLLLNALQHTPTGGTISVVIGAADTRWSLTVADTGPGVSEAMRAHLFEPFATGRALGTGLGLATAREIVAAHGGTLVSKTPPEGGARFEMELPWHGY